MSFNILILASDKSTGSNFAKSLQLSKSTNDDIFIVGTASHFGRAQLTNNDMTVLIPSEIGTNPKETVEYVEKKTRKKIDLVYETRSGKQMLLLAKESDQIPTFIPEKSFIQTCEDKYQTYKHLEKFGFPVPFTVLLTKPEDVSYAFDKYGEQEYWIREIMGQGGTGSFSSSDKAEIISIIKERNGWGIHTLAEKLPTDSVVPWEDRLSDQLFPGEMINWIALYKDDQLVASQTRKRLYFEHADLTPSGVGYTGAVMSLQNIDIHTLSERIVRSLGSKLNGPIGIDFIVDQNGTLKVTEIQPCRFYTTTYFLSLLGLNFPRLYVDAYRNRPTPINMINPIPSGFLWIQRFGADDNLVHRDQITNFKQTGVLYKATEQIIHRDLPDHIRRKLIKA